MNAYDVIKDFAGPFSTVFAASVAAVLTYVFQKRQSAIAMNKLKLDVFKHNYDIYENCKTLLATVVNDCNDLESMREQTKKIALLYASFNEARFFLPKKLTDHLATCRLECEAKLNLIGQRASISDENDPGKWKVFADQLTAYDSVLARRYTELASVFEEHLRVDTSIF